jgi:hypothetical protein
MRDAAEAPVAEIDLLARAYLGDRDRLETVDRDELARRMRAARGVRRTLRKRGYRAARLQDCYPEWAAAGQPVSRTDGRSATADKVSS